MSLHRSRATDGGACARVLRARADNLPAQIDELPRYEAVADALGHHVCVLAWPSSGLLTRAQWQAIREDLVDVTARAIENGRNGKPLRMMVAEAVCARLLEHDVIAIASVRVGDPGRDDA